MNPVNWTLLTAGVICLILFAVHERKTETPLLDLSLLKIRLFRMGTIVTTLIAIGYYVSFMLMPILLQEVYKYSATVTGLLYIPDALMTGIFMIIGGKMLDRRGAKYVVATGLAVIGLTTLLLGRLDDASPLWYIAVLLAVRGAGFGLSSIPATTAGMGALPEHHLVEGSTLNDLVEQIASSFAIVVCLLAFEFYFSSPLSGFRPAEQENLEIINSIFTVLGILNLLVLGLWWKSFHKQKAVKSIN